MSTRVVLADDHSVVREALRVLLEREGIAVAGEAGDGHEAVRLCSALRPDVAVIDVTMPLLNGLDAAREVLRLPVPIAVIILTMHEEERYVLEALRAGVAGYVVKTRAADDLIKAIQEVARGSVYFSAGGSRDAVELLADGTPPPRPISARERQVVQLVAEGKTTKEIAAVLHISAKTADSHRTRVMRKLGIHHTAGLVRYAIREGIIEP